MTRLDDIQARHAKATPGPWELRIGNFGGDVMPQKATVGEEGEFNLVDAEFIAHCPDDVRWLLDRVTRLETALTEILATPLLETEARKIARAALDTEQT